jgi:hypothetical protein
VLIAKKTTDEKDGLGNWPMSNFLDTTLYKSKLLRKSSKSISEASWAFKNTMYIKVISMNCLLTSQ